MVWGLGFRVLRVKGLGFRIRVGVYNVCTFIPIQSRNHDSCFLSPFDEWKLK